MSWRVICRNVQDGMGYNQVCSTQLDGYIYGQLERILETKQSQQAERERAIDGAR